jgi:hypothetical protein
VCGNLGGLGSDFGGDFHDFGGDSAAYFVLLVVHRLNWSMHA